MEQNEAVPPHLILKEAENIMGITRGFSAAGILLVTITTSGLVLCVRHQDNPKAPRLTGEQPLPQFHGIS